MTEFKNEQTPFKKMPIISNLSQRKRDKFEQAKKEILNNPENYNRIQKLAADLDKNFNAQTQIATSIRIGATFLDTLSKKIMAYESFVAVYPHDVKTLVITEMARHPLDEFPREHHMIFYDASANPSPRYIMSSIDFCIYLACGIWQTLDANNIAERDFLSSISQ